MENFKNWLLQTEAKKGDPKMEEPITDPISGITYKFKIRLGADKKPVFTRTKGKYADDASFVYDLESATDDDGNNVSVGFDTKERGQIRKALKLISKWSSLSDQDRDKIRTNQKSLIFVGKGNTISGNQANKDNIHTRIGEYDCHRDGDDIVFVNVDNPEDKFTRQMSTEQFKRLRNTFNNSSRRGGQETNRFKLDPSLITKDVINHRADRILGIKSNNTVDTGLSLNKKYEQDVANKLDDVLGVEVPQSDASQADQEYYAIGTGDNSQKSDILAVHDRQKFNSDKKKLTDKDSSFYVEVKLNKIASFLNPFFTWTEEDGFKSTHSYGFDGTGSDDSGSPDKDQAIEDKELLAKTVDKKTSGKNRLEQIMDSVAGDQMEVYRQDVESLIEAYNRQFNEKLDVKEIRFPDILKTTVPKIYREVYSSKDDDRMIIEKYVRSLNSRKLKQKSGSFKKGDGSLYVVDGQLVSGSDIDTFLGMITKYYLDKGCAYIQIGPLGGDDSGNLYILDRKYDPLNLLSKNSIPDFATAFDKCKFNVTWDFRDGHVYLSGTLRFPDSMVKKSEVSIDDKNFSVDDMDTKGEFFDK